MPSIPSRPPYDVELADALSKIPIPQTITEAYITPIRYTKSTADPAEFNANFSHEEVTIPGPATDIILSIWRKRSSTSRTSTGLYYIHGGGMVMGSRHSGVVETLGYLEDFDAMCVSVEYHLAPEYKDPIPVEDCYARFRWMAENAVKIGLDSDKIILAGFSAEGGLASGVSFLARDRNGPKIRAKMLLSPMLDNRSEKVSSKQYVEDGTWTRGSNSLAWKLSLGEQNSETDKVSIYASPSRASNLSSLPTAYIDVGAAEVFRDEDVAYATRLWHCGVQAGLHVWPGAFHAFDLLASKAEVSIAASGARKEWMKRTISKLEQRFS